MFSNFSPIEHMLPFSSLFDCGTDSINIVLKLACWYLFRNLEGSIFTGELDIYLHFPILYFGGNFWQVLQHGGLSLK